MRNFIDILEDEFDEGPDHEALATAMALEIAEKSGIDLYGRNPVYLDDQEITIRIFGPVTMGQLNALSVLGRGGIIENGGISDVTNLRMGRKPSYA